MIPASFLQVHADEGSHKKAFSFNWTRESSSSIQSQGNATTFDDLADEFHENEASYYDNPVFGSIEMTSAVNKNVSSPTYKTVSSPANKNAWQQYWDSDTKKHYWYNRETEESTWAKPAEYVDRPLPAYTRPLSPAKHFASNENSSGFINSNGILSTVSFVDSEQRSQKQQDNSHVVLKSNGILSTVSFAESNSEQRPQSKTEQHTDVPKEGDHKSTGSWKWLPCFWICRQGVAKVKFHLPQVVFFFCWGSNSVTIHFISNIFLLLSVDPHHWPV